MIRKNIKIFAAVLLLLTNLFIWNVIWAESGSSLSVYFLDVGQGDSILIESPSGNQMIIDAGQNRKALEEISKILPFHDKKIDVILATHPDADHIGGFPAIFDKFEVDFVIEPGVKAETRIFDDFENSILKSKAQRIIAQRGMKIDLGRGAELVILFPDRDISGLNPNDASIIAKLYFGETSFMLTGDASQKMENYLSLLDDNVLDSDVLKVGHHGSNTSSAESFVNLVSPKYAIIQAGKDNKYGHPHSEILDILDKSQAKILGTYESGTILIKSDGENLDVDI